MTVRLDADEAIYQAAKAVKNTKPLYEEDLVREYRHWRIVKNRFPHTKLADENHMLVLKRKADMGHVTLREWWEFAKIVNSIAHEYDNLVYNMPSIASVIDVPHCHLYRLKEEFR